MFPLVNAVRLETTKNIDVKEELKDMMTAICLDLMEDDKPGGLSETWKKVCSKNVLRESPERDIIEISTIGDHINK